MEAPFMDRLAPYMTGDTKISVSLGGVCDENPETDLEISTIYIDENERKHGKMKKIIEEIIDLSRAYGFERIWIKAQRTFRQGEFTQPESDVLVKIYEKFGFEVQEERYPGIIMKLELKAEKDVPGHELVA